MRRPVSLVLARSRHHRKGPGHVSHTGGGSRGPLVPTSSALAFP